MNQFKTNSFRNIFCAFLTVKFVIQILLIHYLVIWCTVRIILPANVLASKRRASEFDIWNPDPTISSRFDRFQYSLVSGC